MKWKSWGGLFLVAATVISCSGGGDQAETKAVESAQTAAVGQTAVPTAAAGGAAGECGVLVKSHCSACHQIARVCQKLGQKSEKRWARTVSRMVGRGAKLTAAEESEVVDCLTHQSAELQGICSE